MEFDDPDVSKNESNRRFNLKFLFLIVAGAATLVHYRETLISSVESYAWAFAILTLFLSFSWGIEAGPKMFSRSVLISTAFSILLAIFLLVSHVVSASPRLRVRLLKHGCVSDFEQFLDPRAELVLA